MKKEKVFSIGLPKWPQCVINGKDITKEQALEIIRRTDVFFTRGYGGNNRKFNKLAKKICNIPDIADFKNENNETNWEKFWDALDAYKEKWGIVDTNYIHNDWVSSCFIGGPHGWCHPDGKIAYQNNIGKWPSVKEVYDDLIMIAKEFPFLELDCTLMSGEECEDYTNSLVTFHMENGKVEFIDTIPKEKLKLERKSFSYNIKSETTFTIEEIKQFAQKVYENPTF